MKRRVTLRRLDPDLHEPFPLVLAARIKPAPIIPIGNMNEVVHEERYAPGGRRRAAIYYSPPLYRRVFFKGDWT